MYKVLVADDHAIVRSGISYLVNQQPGFTVVDGTASGTDTYLRIEQGGIDILIMDLSMPPGESGLITTKRIHDKFPKVKIIILSMHEEQEYINRAMSNGAMSYILKSSSDGEILTALKHVVNGENYLDANILISKSDLKQINASGADVNLKGYNVLSKRKKKSSHWWPSVIPTERFPKSSLSPRRPLRPIRPISPASSTSIAGLSWFGMLFTTT